MNVTALKRKLDLTPKPAAPVVALPPRSTPRRAAWRKRGQALTAGVLHPLQCRGATSNACHLIV